MPDSPSPAATKPRIVLDGVFFQLFRSGIGRVWRSYLERWAGTAFAAHLVVLDRGGMGPRLPGLVYRDTPPFDPRDLGAETLRIETWCAELQADLYVSTFYSSPVRTRSLAMVYDMIYEIETGHARANWDEDEKALALLHARHLAAISHNTARDVRRFYPFLREEDISVVPCGVDPAFAPAPAATVAAAREKFDLRKPYFLLVGSRQGFNGYKNGVFLVRTLDGMKEAADFDVICVGGEREIGPLAEFKNVTPRLLAHVGEGDLVALYSGAQALVYPSRYEGFGLPLLEAMACGCPVITSPNGSIPEVAGAAALFVAHDRPAELETALRRVGDPAARAELVAQGFARARLFSWEKSAEQLAALLLKTAALPEMPPREAMLWQVFREKEKRGAQTLKKSELWRRTLLKLGRHRLQWTKSRPKS